MTSGAERLQGTRLPVTAAAQRLLSQCGGAGIDTGIAAIQHEIDGNIAKGVAGTAHCSPTRNELADAVAKGIRN